MAVCCCPGIGFLLPPKIQPVDHPLAVVLEDEVGGVVGVALGGEDLIDVYPSVAQELGGLGLAQADALGGEELVVCPEGKAADAALAEIALLARHDIAAAARASASPPRMSSSRRSSRGFAVL